MCQHKWATYSVTVDDSINLVSLSHFLPRQKKIEIIPLLNCGRKSIEQRRPEDPAPLNALTWQLRLSISSLGNFIASPLRLDDVFFLLIYDIASSTMDTVCWLPSDLFMHNTTPSFPGVVPQKRILRGMIIRKMGTTCYWHPPSN